MNAQIWLLSGPNLNELGTRAPEVYGTATLDEHVARFTELAATFDCAVHHVQSNFEGDLIEAVHRARHHAVAIVINPGALTHYSWSLRDALESFPGISIEIHLSNPAAREEFRHHSTISSVVDGTIAGFGRGSYELAAYAVRDRLQRTT